MLSLVELRRVAEWLAAERAGARVSRIAQPGPMELVLHLSGGAERAPGDRCALLLSCQPGAARISERPARPQPGAAEERAESARAQGASGASAQTASGGREAGVHAQFAPLALAQWLRAQSGGARGGGARLCGAGVDGAERQVRLRFEARSGSFSLMVSLLGARANLYGLDGQDRVMAAARPLSETRRDLKLGAPWRDPPGGAPGPGEDRFAAVADADLLAAIELHYTAAQSQQNTARLARRIHRALHRQRARMERKLQRVQADLAAGEEAQRLEKQGELLKAHLGEIAPGASSAVFPDFESGAPVEIALDPKLGAADNMQRLFRLARKAAKRARKAAADVEAVRARLAENAALCAEAESAAPGPARAAGAAGAADSARPGSPATPLDEAALHALARRPEVARLLERHAPPPAAAPRRVWRVGKRELPARLAPKRYRTADGLEVWVGKSDEGNDILTTRLARGSDLFFHIEGDPGSHVILRTGKDEPPQESLLEAAELAVNFSRARHATRAAVHIAAVKDISKPRGAKPGLVYVHRGRALQLRRNPERLARILAARLED